MTKKSNWLRLWLRLAALTSATVIAGPLAGCKTSVQQAFYAGLENLAVSLVQTFFEAITPTSSTTTAQSIVHSLQTWLI
jgi:hypothetical protein